MGAPQSLNFIGLALRSAALLAALHWVETPQFGATVSAYGIITRLITFAFLPLLGLSHAKQTITGQNLGAGAFDRGDASWRIAVRVSLAHFLILQISMSVFAADLGAAFVTDAAVVSEVANILPILAAGFFLAQPLMMLAMHVQAIEGAGRAALLGLSKPYLFAIPLTFLMAAQIGEVGIWLAAPAAEALLLAVSFTVLTHLARHRALRWGLFQTRKGGGYDPRPAITDKRKGGGQGVAQTPGRRRDRT